MRPGTTEYGLMILFDVSLQPKLPLGTDDKLNNPEFPIPISFVYGSNDWTRVVDTDFGKKIVETNRGKFGSQSNFLIVPDADHNMHMDNPQALANTVINDLLGFEGEEKLPVLPLSEQEAGDHVDYQREFEQDQNEIYR
mmetsp:Transcript_24695/g.38429  ORF Transcript_24695/g.38429 Transcript_24695/m.38429 type:complete len:139 (+) Transcript_24695:824-1240(+)